MEPIEIFLHPEVIGPIHPIYMCWPVGVRLGRVSPLETLGCVWVLFKKRMEEINVFISKTIKA